MRTLIAAFVFVAAFAQSPADAQKTAPDRCLALARHAPPTPQLLHKTQFRLAALKPYQVRVTYNGHSTFTIESPKGVTAATDYNDIVGPTLIPTIVTMNVAHSTHFTTRPDERIKHVLRGWNPNGDAAAIHDLTELDLRVRNVPTNIRSSFAGPASGRYGNSVFVFEVGSLCIAHLGHLHHTLTNQQLAQIGQMDVALVPIDGTYTLDTVGMFEVLKSLKARIVIPMHYFSSESLARFLDAAAVNYEVVRHPSSSVVISRDQMPARPQVMVLLPGG